MSNYSYTFSNLDEAALCKVALQMAESLSRQQQGGVIFLQGELGAGKTTFARALLQGLGITTRVKSPTYTLIESYQAGNFFVYHLDLYRIADPGELEWLGLPDLFGAHTLFLIEWPERGVGGLPSPDLKLNFIHVSDKRDLVITALGIQGENWLKIMQKRCGGLINFVEEDDKHVKNL